jgi:hypothetical protein
LRIDYGNSARGSIDAQESLTITTPRGHPLPPFVIGNQRNSDEQNTENAKKNLHDEQLHGIKGIACWSQVAGHSKNEQRRPPGWLLRGPPGPRRTLHKSKKSTTSAAR